jgi:formamidopyrimidine-DNA glycosylase
MPELPEVEITRRGLEKALLNERLSRIEVRRRDLRQPIPENFGAVLQGQRVTSTLRRGKYILAFLGNDSAFVLHLGMSGRIYIAQGDAARPERHDHVIFETDKGLKAIYSDPRRFGLLYLTTRQGWEQEEPFAAMGPEPLAENFTGAVLTQGLVRRTTPIKAALLDQKIVAGIGNIYACEALFEAGIDPARPASSISSVEAEVLAGAMQAVLNRALEAGGSTLRDYKRTDGVPGYFQHSFSVYDREGQACPGCICGTGDEAKGVKRVRQSGRSTFYCARKQK